MKLSLVNLVLMLIIAALKGILDAELSDAPCTHLYQKKYNHKAPHPNLYRISDNAGYDLQSCKDECNWNPSCRSISHRSGNFCGLYTVTMQELYNKKKEDDIYIIPRKGAYGVYAYFSYDKYCECPAGREQVVKKNFHFACKACKYGFFKASAGFEKCTKCAGEVSKDKKSCVCPAGQETITTPEKAFCKSCKDGFFKASKGSEKCIKCKNGTVPEDKTSCSKCTNTYPVSHNRTSPWHILYAIGSKRNNISATKETCQEYCNQDFTCKSVLYESYYERIWRTRRYQEVTSCVKFNISVQDLYDSGRDNDTMTIGNEVLTRFHWRHVNYTHITYDRSCGKWVPIKYTATPGTGPTETTVTPLE